MANRAAMRLSVRLRTHRILTLTATLLGEDGCVTLASGRGGAVELNMVFPEANDESCREICASS